MAFGNMRMALVSAILLITGCGAPASVSTLSETSPALSPYYAGTADRGGEDLRIALHDIIKGHQRFTYGQLFDILLESDRDPNDPDRVLLAYSGVSSPRRAWNREHVWAKSHGFPHTSSIPYSDAHHIRPCNVALNTARSSRYFAVVDGKRLDDLGNKAAGNFFEPADHYKGDVARMIFYMDVRYEGDAENEPQLVVADNHLGVDGKDGTVARFGMLSDLLQWHEADPVDDLERHRNDVIHAWQGNRNPFIDHPEFAGRIWQTKGASH